MSSCTEITPVFFSGKVIHGAGRGGTQLGFPTANVDASSLQEQIKDLKDGVYYGYAKVVGGDGHAEPMVMSIGQNVTFDATHKTVEVHILKEYEADFYGSTIQVGVVGHIREMIKFDGIESLIQRIKDDIRQAKERFELPEVNTHANNAIFADAPRVQAPPPLNPHPHPSTVSQGFDGFTLNSDDLESINPPLLK